MHASSPAYIYDIFLSHNNAQKDWTRDLARRLSDDGFRVWFDEFVLPKEAGKNWIDSLAEGVERSRKIALVLSEEFFSNSWPEFEGNMIQSTDPIGRQQRVIPLLYAPCDIPLKWGFRQAIDFRDCQPGSDDFEFRYHQLLYNLDNERPYEGDFDRFKAALRFLRYNQRHTKTDQIALDKAKQSAKVRIVSGWKLIVALTFFATLIGLAAYWIGVWRSFAKNQSLLSFERSTERILIFVSKKDPTQPNSDKIQYPVRFEPFIDDVHKNNKGMDIQEVYSWFNDDKGLAARGDKEFAGNANLIVLGGPIGNDSFWHVRQQLLNQLRECKTFNNFPVDFSHNIYDIYLSGKEYCPAPQNGIFFGYDFATGQALTEEVALERYCNQASETWLRSIVKQSNQNVSQEDELCIPSTSGSSSVQPCPKDRTKIDYDVDYGFFLVGPNPFDKTHAHRLMILSGTHHVGTLGTLSYISKLTKKDFYDLVDKNPQLSSNLGYFEGVVKVTHQRPPELIRAVAF